MSSPPPSTPHRTAPPPPSETVSETIRAIYQNWFTIADTNGDGRITGADAVSFFSRSGLSQQTLAKVWAYADERRAGYLDFNGFAKALELVWLFQERAAAQHTMQAYEEEKRAGGAGVLLGPPRLKGLVGGLYEDVREKEEMDEVMRNFTPHYSAADREVGGSAAGVPVRTNTHTREVKSFASPPVPLASTPEQASLQSPGSSFGGLYRSVDKTMPISSALLRGSFSKQSASATKSVGGFSYRISLAGPDLRERFLCVSVSVSLPLARASLPRSSRASCFFFSVRR